MANSSGKIIGYIIAAILILFGILFVLASYAASSRLFVGLILLAIGFGIIVLIKMNEPKPDQKVEIVQKVELSGSVRAQDLKCKQCGATLDSGSVTVQAGAVFVKCPYCKSQYQVTEEPKW
jgi:phage FluMu protein Com